MQHSGQSFNMWQNPTNFEHCEIVFRSVTTTHDFNKRSGHDQLHTAVGHIDSAYGLWHDLALSHLADKEVLLHAWSSAPLALLCSEELQGQSLWSDQWSTVDRVVRLSCTADICTCQAFHWCPPFSLASARWSALHRRGPCAVVQPLHPCISHSKVGLLLPICTHWVKYDYSHTTSD